MIRRTMMASPPLTYAKAGVTPGWHRMRVFDRDLGDIVSKVVEVNVTEGWLIRAVTDAKGRIVVDPSTGSRKFELMRGHYVILTCAETPRSR